MTQDPQHLDLDAIEKRRASASEWLVHQPSNSIGWGSTAWVVDADVPDLVSRIRELEADTPAEEQLLIIIGKQEFRITELEDALRLFAEPHIVDAEHDEQTSQILVPREWCDLAARVFRRQQ
jgi:hypothetical protein